MNTPSTQLYTNEVSPEFLRTLDHSPFTEQQLSGFSDEVMTCVREQQAHRVER